MRWTRQWTRQWTRANRLRSRILTEATVATDPARVHARDAKGLNACMSRARVHTTVSTVSLVRNRAKRAFARVHLRGGHRVHLSGGVV